MPPSVGSSAVLDLEVAPGDTAASFSSGDVDVLATPRVLALCEQACCEAVAGQLGEGETSVGMRVQLDHLAAVRVGSTVRAEATLDKVEGRRLVFVVTVKGDAGLVAAGRLTRALVDRVEFLDKAR